MVVFWSPTRIDYANYCKMRYWLRYVEKEDALRLSAYVKGGLLHDSIEKFRDKLGTEEEVSKKSSKKKYSNREQFARHLKGKWQSLVIGSKTAKFPIIWSYDSEPYVVKEQLGRIGLELFDYLIGYQPPVFSEMPFEFSLLGEHFRGRIDEVRLEDGKIIVRDYKSGRPWVGPMKERHDLQLTLYNVALCSLAKSDLDFARKLGLEDRRNMYMGNPMYVDPDIGVEFFMLEALGTENKVIHRSSRTDAHFFELLRMINGINKAVNEREVYPERGRKCDACDMRHVCDGLLEKVSESFSTDKRGQGLLDFAVPLYMKQSQGEIDDERKRIEKEQPRLKLRRDLKNYRQQHETGDKQSP